MKTWLKGGLIGLIGAVLGIISRIIVRPGASPTIENIFRWPIVVITAPFNFLDQFLNTLFSDIFPLTPSMKGTLMDILPLFVFFSISGYLYYKNKKVFWIFIAIYILICILGSFIVGP